MSGHYPLAPTRFDVIVSNFVLHEMNARADRERMVHEMIRVLKPGGRLALIDFIFTKECVEILSGASAVDAARTRIGGLANWIGSVLLLGTFQLHAVTATKGFTPLEAGSWNLETGS